MNMSFKLPSLVLAVLSFLLPAWAVDAAEIKMLGALGLKAVIDDLVPKFESASGHRLLVTFAPLGEAVKLVQGGATFDVVIIPQQGMEGFLNSGIVDADNSRLLARSGMAVAVRKG